MAIKSAGQYVDYVMKNDGWAAIHLDMPPRVPRTEYSVESHWALIERVTGIQVEPTSPEPERARASDAFMRAWNYDFFWSILIEANEFGDVRTKMGHAEYAAGGVDRDDDVVCPFTSPEDVLNFDPWEAFGTKNRSELRDRFTAHYEEQAQRHPEGVTMTGIYVTLVSGLIDLFGWDMLLQAAGEDQEAFGELANRYASWILQYFEALADSSAPVVMVHDDIVWTAGPFIRPDWYRQYVFPNYKKLFAPLREANKRIAYTSDGNFSQFIDDVAASGVHGFVMEPMTDMQAIADRYGKTHFFIGNADTHVLLRGTREQIRAEVERCMAIGKNCPGYFMAVGNHIPANTPVENCLYYNEVYEELSKR